MPKTESSPSTDGQVRKSSRVKKLVNASLLDDLSNEEDDSGDEFIPENTKRKDWSEDDSEKDEVKPKKARPGRKPKCSIPVNAGINSPSSVYTGINSSSNHSRPSGPSSVHGHSAGLPTKVNQSSGLHASNINTAMSNIKQEPKGKVETISCSFCNETLKVNINARFHYSMHYYDEDAFLSLLKPEDLKDGKAQDETGKVVKYACSFDGCTKRKMGYKEICVHLATAHQKLKNLMAADTRPGMKEVFHKLFPAEPFTTETQVKLEKDVVTPSVGSSGFELDNSEDVDDPSEPVQVQVKAPSPKKNIGVITPSVVKTEVKYRPRIHRVDKVHSCLLCNGPGKSNKEGRNLSLGAGITELKYHYGMCVYAEGPSGLFRYIDHGQGAGKRFEDLEEYGKKYQYRCPWVSCPKHHGRTKPIGYKEYAIHVGVAHHQVERWMVADDRPGMRQVYDAVVAAREQAGEVLEEMPPELLVDKMHTCLICNGEDKDGKQLSFEGNKLFGLRYHYASCLYDEGSYRGKYPPGPDNTTADGEPRDILGKEVKYSCEEKGCNNKRTMSYKTFVIHMSNDHGGLEEAIKNHSRPEIRALSDKIKKRKRVIKTEAS